MGVEETAERASGGTALRAALVVCLGLTGVWAIAALVVSGRGLAGSNEGYYLLSYLHWQTDARTFSMAQYYYGPLFDLLGHDVARLRVVRLASVLGAHAVFGWQFMAWLRTARPGAPRTRLWEAAGTAAISASGGVIYGWLPATPGYNDVSVLGTMTLLAGYFRTLVRRSEGERAGRVTMVAMGGVGTLMVLAKATMLPSVGVIGVATALALGSRRETARLLVHAVAGAALVLGVLQLFEPLRSTLPPLWSSLRVISDSGHQPTDLALGYVSSVAQTCALAFVAFVLPGLALMAAMRKLPGRWTTAAPIVAVGVNLVLVGLAGGLRAGVGHVGAYQAGIVAMVITVCLAALGGGRSGGEALQLALVLAAPLLAALGTNNPLVAIAVGGSAMWVAAMIGLTSSLSAAAPWRRHLAVAAVAGALLICFSVAATGVTHTPAGDSLLGAGRSVTGVPVLSGVRIQEARAGEIDRLRTELAPYVEPAGRPMLAFGELSDEVLVLNGRPVGNAWFSAGEDGLQVADLRAACRHGNPWERQPLVLAGRELTGRERAGFHACGLDLDRDYTVLELDADSDLRAFVPSSEVSGP